MIHDSLADAAIDIKAVRQHPRNPRRGDITRIKASLAANGQYRPIVVNRRDMTILAGNHTHQAAVELGWTTIAAVFVDVPEDEAVRILLADNRTAELATYDNSRLLDALDTVGDLTGTGFDESDLLALMDDEPLRFPEDDDDPEPADPVDEDTPPVRDPRFCVLRLPSGETVDVNLGAALDWYASTSNHQEDLRGRLGIPRLEKAPRLNSEPIPRIGTVEARAVDAVTCPVEDLQPHPQNPRQGDVGAIAESLARNGQYRPIVVNRRTMTVLAGTHTWLAAKHLGWTDIAVSYVDVDDTAALRILLADNRTADEGGFDEATLGFLLGGLGDLEGTGYDLDDLDDILAKAQANARPSKRAVVQLVCDHVWAVQIRCEWPEYDTWYAGLVSTGDVAGALLARLALGEAATLNVDDVDVTIRVGEWADVEPFKAAAAKERVSATPSDACSWVIATVDDQVVGFVGVLRHGKDLRYARVKGVWLAPHARGVGIGQRMTDYAINWVTAEMPEVERLDVLAYNPGFYEARGWTPGKPRANGAVPLTLALETDEADG